MQKSMEFPEWKKIIAVANNASYQLIAWVTMFRMWIYWTFSDCVKNMQFNNNKWTKTFLNVLPKSVRQCHWRVEDVQNKITKWKNHRTEFYLLTIQKKKSVNGPYKWCLYPKNVLFEFVIIILHKSHHYSSIAVLIVPWQYQKKKK